MSETAGGLQIVTATASGWCDPVTGVCHIDTDEAASEPTNNDDTTGAEPGAAN